MGSYRDHFDPSTGIFMSLLTTGTVIIDGASRSPRAVDPGDSATIRWPGYVLTMTVARDPASTLTTTVTDE